jgi:hypothetical protein
MTQIDDILEQAKSMIPETFMAILAREVERLREEVTEARRYKWIKLGFGLIEVGEGFDCEGVPALLFGRNGGGVIGAPTGPSRTMREDEALAVISFANVESLQVVLDTVEKCKRVRFGGGSNAPEDAPIDQGSLL